MKQKQKRKPIKYYSPYYGSRSDEKMTEAERENAEYYLDMAQERNFKL